MKKLTILLFLFVFILTGCGQQAKIVCEDLDIDQCSEYAEQCGICPDSISSSFTSCHAKTFCNNFENLDQ